MDKCALQSQTFRHSSLYQAALEIVDFGDSNLQAYEIATKYLLQGKAELKEVSLVKDGLSLVDQLASENSPATVYIETMEGNHTECTTHCIKALEKLQKRGRTTSTRDKPPYEQCTK